MEIISWYMMAGYLTPKDLGGAHRLALGPHLLVADHDSS